MQNKRRSTGSDMGLGFLAAFLLSLFHIALAGFSKISLSRFLEDKDKPFGLKVLRHYEEIKIAVEFWRTLLLIAFLVYLYACFPQAKLWPLWLFLGSLLVYGIFFDMLPRLIASRTKEGLLGFFLPSFRLFLILSAPVLAVSRWLCEREESEEEEDEDREASERRNRNVHRRSQGRGHHRKRRGRASPERRRIRRHRRPRDHDPAGGYRLHPEGRHHPKAPEPDHHREIFAHPRLQGQLDNIEGIVIAKDLLPFSDERHGQASIEPFVRPVIFVPESMKVAELLKEFQKAKQKMAIVVDEHGGVSGLVTMEDLVEEIVGEIQDEYDTEEAKISEVGPAGLSRLGRREGRRTGRPVRHGAGRGRLSSRPAA